MTSTLERFHSKINKLVSLERKVDSSVSMGTDHVPESFADIIRKQLGESKKERDYGCSTGITVNAFGQTKPVQDQQVLIVKPKPGKSTNEAKLADVFKTIEGALKSVPVRKLQETKFGSLVVKFLSAEARAQACDLRSSSLEDNEDFAVSQPKKCCQN